MRVLQDVLTPRMQHAHETDLSAQMSGIGSDLQQCGCTGTEQQVIDDSLVRECE